MTFNKINKVIRAYIKYVLDLPENVDMYAPNTHIAEVFKDVLIHSELESLNNVIFHSLQDEPYTSIGENDPDNFIILEDGRYLRKETYNVSINKILIPEYFDLIRLQNNGKQEIYATYQKLREKNDIVRNNIILARIMLHNINRYDTKSYKIKIKNGNNSRKFR